MPVGASRTYASGSVLLSVMLVTVPALSLGEIPASAEWSAALENEGCLVL
jgi:hypothetical protein